MAEMPIGGAGGFAAGAAGNPAGAAGAAPVGKGALGGPPASAQKSELAHDGDAMKARQSAGGTAPGSGDSASASQAVQPDATPALGAGGTSAAVPEPGSGSGVVGRAGTGTKAVGAVAAVPAAGAAGQAMFLMMFANYLKSLMMSGIALSMNAWSMALGLLLTGAKAAVGAVMGLGATISGAVGGVVSAAVAGVSSVVAGTVVAALVVVGAVVGVNSNNDLAQRDGATDCRVSATTALSKIPGDEGSVDAKTLANAKTIYSVLSAWGMPDENIAGIIGNWDAESGVDPTSVQGYFSSPQVMSADKTSAATDTDNGIGLGQWTFGRNANLRTYADGLGKDWWTLDMQLGFMLSAAEGSDAGVVKDMIATPYGTPAEAAIHFHDSWERSADTASMAARRGEKATKWMGLFSGWEKNQALADSILAQAGTTVIGANSSRSQAVNANCIGVDGAALAVKEGGLTLEEATALMELYKSEGETFLQSRYGAGGPGDCGFGKADNCVGFSTYFVNKYTSFQQYARGDGIDTAGSMAELMGKELTHTPTVYSVASGPASGPEGHTFVVLGIQGDQVVIGEAICGTNHRLTRARLMPLSDLTDGAWEFVDVTDLITAEPAVA